MTDIFGFWSQMKRGETVHPADRPVFERIGKRGRNGFETDCLPACFAGRLRTAEVVLLYLSPGYSAQDDKDAASEEGRDYYFRSWQGHEPMRASGGDDETWLRSRTRRFVEEAKTQGDSFDIVRERFAILNIGAYHSKEIKDYAELLALPSSRTSLDWAQRVLFPDAEKGNRMVICMRAASCWGLKAGRVYGAALFAPQVTRSGFLLQNKENQVLVEKVRIRLGLDSRKDIL